MHARRLALRAVYQGSTGHGSRFRQLGRRGLSVLTPPLLDLRRQHRSALTSLEKLLVRLHAAAEHTEVLRESVTTLDSLFVCCVVGEFNAGKSALINALLGREACVEGVLPTTASVCLIKHPAAPFVPSSAAGKEDGLVVMDVDVEWLRSTYLVDTPGTNSIDEAHTALTQDFLPRSDLVLFVTSAQQPFSDSEQAFLRSVTGWRKHVLCVLNKADTLPPADLQRVLEYVSENASRTVGAPVKVLASSARVALKLKERLRQESAAELGSPLRAAAEGEAEGAAAAQWEALEAEVRRVLQDGARLKMVSQLATASRLLEVYASAEASQLALVAADRDAVDDVGQRVHAFQATMRADFEPQVARAMLVLARLGQRGHRFLQEELTLSQLPRLLSRDALVKRFESTVVADSSAQLEAVALSLADWMEGRSSALERDTLSMLRSRVQLEPSSAGDAEAAAAAAYGSRRAELLLAMQSSARESVGSDAVANAGERAVAAVQTCLAQALLLEAGAAGLTGVVSVKAASMLDLTGLMPAFVIALTGLAVLPLQRYRLQLDLQQRVDELSSSLNEALQTHLEAELQHAVTRSLAAVKPFREHVEREHAAHEERRGMLDAVEAELSAMHLALERAERPAVSIVEPKT